MHVRSILAPLFASVATSTLHHLFVSNLFTVPKLHALTFDDVALTLQLTATHNVQGAHSHITFSHDKTNIYASSLTGPRAFASYRLNSPTDLTLSSTIPATGPCTDDNTIFTAPSSEPPYVVYGQSWPSRCASVLAVDETGALNHTLQTFEYAADTGAHGAALGDRMLYSADTRGNAIFGHRLGEGGLVGAMWRIDAPPATGPRHLVVSKNGRWLYVLFETTSDVGVYSINAEGRLGYTGSWSILPAGEDAARFDGNTVALSASGRYLWASTRGGKGEEVPGYIAAFELSEEGAVVRRVVSQRTTTLGSRGNGVSPSDVDDRWVAFADYGSGYVQIWRFDEKRGKMSPVARVDIKDGGCCSNVIWLD